MAQVLTLQPLILLVARVCSSSIYLSHTEVPGLITCLMGCVGIIILQITWCTVFLGDFLGTILEIWVLGGVEAGILVGWRVVL